VVLRGADLPELWPQVAKLLLFLVVMMLIASVRFKKRLD
jgi:ABC-2 type transport system permease protein